MQTLAVDKMMKTQYERLDELEEKVNNIERDLNILVQFITSVPVESSCACGGQGCQEKNSE